MGSDNKRATGTLAIAACTNGFKNSNYRKLYESKKIAKYLELYPQVDSDDRNFKRFFVKDFYKKFHIVGEVTLKGIYKDFPGEVALNGSGKFILGNIYLHMMELDSKEEDIEELKFTEFCGHKVGVRAEWLGESQKLRVEPLGEDILEIDATPKIEGLASKLLIVKLKHLCFPPQKLGNYAAWIEDLKELLTAPRRPRQLIFSQICHHESNCELIHMENLFDLPINLTVAIGVDFERDLCDDEFLYPMKRKNGNTYKLGSSNGFEVKLASITRYEKEFSCVGVGNKIVCRYRAFEIIIECDKFETPSCYCKENLAKALVYTEKTVLFFNFSISSMNQKKTFIFK